MSASAVRPPQLHQELYPVDAATVAAIAATGSVVLGLMPKDYAVTSFEVSAPGGYTADDTNRYTLTLQSGATVLATIDLKTTGGGGVGNLTDLVFTAGVLAAVPTGLAGDTLKVVMTKNGTAANLPANTRFVAKTLLL